MGGTPLIRGVSRHKRKNTRTGSPRDKSAHKAHTQRRRETQAVAYRQGRTAAGAMRRQGLKAGGTVQLLKVRCPDVHQGVRVFSGSEVGYHKNKVIRDVPLLYLQLPISLGVGFVLPTEAHRNKVRLLQNLGFAHLMAAPHLAPSESQRVARKAHLVSNPLGKAGRSAYQRPDNPLGTALQLMLNADFFLVHNHAKDTMFDVKCHFDIAKILFLYKTATIL